jgi:hypothetical protein
VFLELVHFCPVFKVDSEDLAVAVPYEQFQFTVVHDAAREVSFA